MIFWRMRGRACRCSRTRYVKSYFNRIGTKLLSFPQLGHLPPASDDPEISRMLEALVADNEALKRDAAELQNMLTESREDARAFQEEIAEMRARGEGGQEALGEDG
jgi:hypothetical protein